MSNTDKTKLIEILEDHKERVKNQATELYLRRLDKTIEKLHSDYYDENQLIIDLQSLGFQDLAINVRRSMYL